MDKKKVTVLTPNGRRQTLTINSNTTILQILEQVCDKYGFDSQQYGLLHHNKELDLSLMFRYTGLPNNCFLEMIETSRKREDGEIILCIQLENGSRKQGTFKSSDTLQQIIQNLCPESCSPEQQPVVVYMRRDISGSELESTTLRSLGISNGRAMLRLINRSLEDLKQQANVYVPPNEPLKTDNNAELQTKPGSSKASGSVQITTDVIKSLKVEKESTLTKNSKETEIEDEEKSVSKSDSSSSSPSSTNDWGTGTGNTLRDNVSQSAVEPLNIHDENADVEMTTELIVNELGERHAIAFSLQSIQRVSEDLPDSFFELTVDDMKLILRDLHKEYEGNEDAPLLTSKLRQIEKQNKLLYKLGKHKECVIRIQFPDRHVLQGIFKPVEKVETVYEFVRKYLRNPDLDFHLFTIPPKNIPNKDKTLLEVDFVPTALLHFGVENAKISENESYLKNEVLENLTSPEAALRAASKNRSNVTELASSPEKEKRPDKSTGAIPKQRKFDEPRRSSDKSRLWPKWFKPVSK